MCISACSYHSRCKQVGFHHTFSVVNDSKGSLLLSGDDLAVALQLDIVLMTFEYQQLVLVYNHNEVLEYSHNLSSSLESNLTTG